MADNQRLFYAVTAVGFAPDGSDTFTAAHGVQSIGVNTRFNLEDVFELGQLQVYQQLEALPEVEVTTSKVLDGYPLLWHLATYGAPDASLVGRSNQKCAVAVSMFGDTQLSASGKPVSQMVMSGLFTSSLGYDFRVDANFMENVTLVGNNKYWVQIGSGVGELATFSGGFDNTDSPLAVMGVNRRQHFVWESSVLPTEIAGISSSGTNDRDSAGNYKAHVQGVRINSNFGRDNLLELGRKGPYFRFIGFPVDVNAEIEIMNISGDMVAALENGVGVLGENVTNQAIAVHTSEGTHIDLGDRNKLSQVSHNGPQTSRGNNSTLTYSYVGKNTLLVTHPQDPTTALAQ